MIIGGGFITIIGFGVAYFALIWYACLWAEWIWPLVSPWVGGCGLIGDPNQRMNYYVFYILIGLLDIIATIIPLVMIAMIALGTGFASYTLSNACFGCCRSSYEAAKLDAEKAAAAKTATATELEVVMV